MTAQLVYFLCSITSLGCAALLFRSYKSNRNGMLFWTGSFFTLLAISNILLFIDLVIVPQTDLSLIRTAITAVAHLLLIFGLVSKTS